MHLHVQIERRAAGRNRLARASQHVELRAFDVDLDEPGLQMPLAAERVDARRRDLDAIGRVVPIEPHDAVVAVRAGRAKPRGALLLGHRLGTHDDAAGQAVERDVPLEAEARAGRRLEREDQSRWADPLSEQHRIRAEVCADVEHGVAGGDVGLERVVLLGVPRDLPERRREPDRFAVRKTADEPIPGEAIEHRFVGTLQGGPQRGARQRGAKQRRDALDPARMTERLAGAELHHGTGGCSTSGTGKRRPSRTLARRARIIAATGG